MMPAATFQMPSMLLIGAGAIAELPAQVKRLLASRVLLVTDAFSREMVSSTALSLHWSVRVSG